MLLWGMIIKKGDFVKKQALHKHAVSVSVLIVILISISSAWFFSEKAYSYSEPQEAIIAIEKDLLLIPSYKLNDDALFFFIKDKNNLGATYVQKGLLGWKAGILTWSAMDNNRNYDKFNGVQSNGENLTFGLIKYKEKLIVKMDENNAQLLMLDVMFSPGVVEEYQLEDLCIWYFENVTVPEGKTIELINNSREVIDIISS